MNYLIEINGFNRFCDVNHISTNGQIIWYKLLDLVNSTRRRGFVGIDNERFMDKTQIKNEGTFRRARKELIDLGLIEYESGSKNSPSMYKLISFKDVFSNTNKVFEVNVEGNTEVNIKGNTVDIYKGKEKDKTHITFTVFEALWCEYPVRKNADRVTYESKMTMESIGLKTMVLTLENYLSYVKKRRSGGFDLQYQDGCNWFNSGYKDYLPNERKPFVKKELVFKTERFL